MPDVPGTVNFPTSLDSTVSLIEAANNAATTLSANASSSDTTLTVASTASFASSGAISIEGEVIFYTGKSGTTFTGCVRGADDTVAASHTSGVAVQGLIVAAHHNTLAEAVIATQTKLGSGSGAPGSGQVLQGNGSGTSEWAALPDATTSDGGLMSATDKAKLDGATSSATANTLMMRDANARAQVATPSASGDIATKGYVDSQIGGGGVTAVTASGGLSSTGGTTPDISISDGGVTDAKIGNRTLDDSAVPASNTASVTTLFSNLGNSVKGITGKSDWKTAPDATLQDAADHIADINNPHSTTAAQTGALAISNNLSDLNSASSARSNLGLGTSATLNAPSSGDASSLEVVKGDDSRLSGSRPPSGTAGGDLSGSYPNPSLANGSATDTKIGNRTVDDTVVPASNTASLTTLLSNLANSVKGITGKSGWKTAPDATLQEAADHIADTNNPHATTASQVGALAVSNNLSDLNSAGTARTNLGLGTSATLNVAAAGDAASGEVVKGNDTRLTNSRTPSGSAGGDLTGSYPNPTLANNSVTDAKIGDRTVNQSTAMGGTPNTGSLTTLLGRFGNIIKAITGKTNWSDTPAISLESLSAHKDRHKSGGADAFTSSDLIEAVGKRLQESSGPTNLTVGSVSDGQFLKRDGSNIVGANAGNPDYILIRDEKPLGTEGGTFTSGAWRTRDLNTEVNDSGGHASISSNQVTLAAGTYQVLAFAPANRVELHQARLYNVSDSAVIILGSSIRNGNNPPNEVVSSIIAGQFTLSSSKTISIQHRCSTTKTDDGFGCQVGFSTEVYTILQLWKVA